jgi:hypothetical protein
MFMMKITDLNGKHIVCFFTLVLWRGYELFWLILTFFLTVLYDILVVTVQH